MFKKKQHRLPYFVIDVHTADLTNPASPGKAKRKGLKGNADTILMFLDMRFFDMDTREERMERVLMIEAGPDGSDEVFLRVTPMLGNHDKGAKTWKVTAVR